MTETLQAMIAAMAAELDRQHKAGQLGWYRAFVHDDGRLLPNVDGNVDLEAVARAGLAAIREPGRDVEAGIAAADRAADPFIGTKHEGTPADPADAWDAWRFAIAAILGEPGGVTRHSPDAPSSETA